ncbi:MAG: MoaD/ThiS family protein [Pseudonocardiaceae bacterium]
MSVTVHLPSMLRQTAGGVAEIEIACDSLGGVLDLIGERFPALARRLRDETGALRRYVNFYVDGEECRRLDGLATPLRDGSEVVIIPSVAGG